MRMVEDQEGRKHIYLSEHNIMGLVKQLIYVEERREPFHSHDGNFFVHVEDDPVHYAHDRETEVIQWPPDRKEQ